ncbi:S8 family peptidase [Sphingosinicella microcystinivorans]|uniref:Subtilisin family serine protease n=1 Tax=Sphingosinicella microcystinivorans TaxID=335406 RepID=A0ABX9T084_SPHMI|nr:S8 family peptidase [Sphingosinicella microcystinivorans]RKS90808.1 subtilisin family serine protease [Sphingosinicella microcystinivorans]
MAAFLAACGGGGGGTRPVAPGTVTPPPTPTPTPTPTPSPVYDTPEYNRSNAAASAGAIAAYEDGATGAGVKIAVIDSGVDIQSAEFTGRIDPASRDIAGTRGIDDADGHGTSVSAVALAAKNDSGMHGLAFNATLIALRTDTPGTCAASDGCSHSDSNIATAIDTAVAAGARVINMSLGGEGPNSRLRTAIANATAAGVIVVISAGNDSLANPDPFAQIAADPAARGRVIIAGSVNDTDALSDFSNRAGSYAAYYLATLGERVRSFDHTGTAYLFGGTSYAAPGISGAVALLADAFPSLSADEIIDILFRTARDAGTAGDDSVFGQGILDLIRAFSPIGATSLAGSAVPVTGDAGSLAVLGGALGDGGDLTGALSDVVVLDSYDRAYVADLGTGISRATPAPRLAAALQTNTEEARDALGIAGYSLSWNAAVSTRPWLGLAQSGGVDARADADARITRGFATGSVTPGTGIGFAAGYGADDLLANMAGTRAPGSRFIASGDALRDDGVSVVGTRAAAVSQRIGAWTFGMAAGTGETESLRPGNAWDRRRNADPVTLFAASASRQIGASDVTVTWSRLDESGSILGAEGSTALGLTRASSDFLGLDWAMDAGHGWRIAAQARGGLTHLDVASGGLISGANALRSLAFAFDVTKSGVAMRGDTVSVRIAQPLRVEGGALRADIPTSYDYETETAGYTRRTFTLAPSGREISVEAAWSLPLADFGHLDTNLFWRRDPGHIAALDDDMGAALRLRARF